MGVKELNNYEYWIGKSADKIHAEVRSLGGWKTVFPGRLPKWASKVRNYFNMFPTSLLRLPDKEAKTLLKYVQKFKFQLECHEVQWANRNQRNYKPDPAGRYDPDPFDVPAGCPVTPTHDVMHTSTAEAIAIKSAFTGQVYRDESNFLWYQMAAGSTIYHWGRQPYKHWLIKWFANPIEAAWVDKVRGQNDTIVFKLICPDATGGSREVILLNDGVSSHTWGGGRESVAAVGERANVQNFVVTDPAAQGSYNYSETALEGFAQHKKRDIDPHVEGRRFYVNPDNSFSAFDRRIFPPADLDGKPLASQK